ncbi:MAG TPA: hypothetical protein VHO84_14620 [Syntrophorhabdaceae bacterium]|nr:hypothetical protein [Syntrophorhabdaceae bacterium]
MAGDTWSATTGPYAPVFSIETGEGKTINNDNIRGKIAVIFYETKDATRQNAETKGKLDEMVGRQSDSIKRMIVRHATIMDFSHVLWPITELWKNGLRDNSKRVGMMVFCDWTGNVSRNFQMAYGQSNLVIIDQQAVIRYRFFGKIDSTGLK